MRPRAPTDRKVPIHVMMDMALLSEIDGEASAIGTTRSELIRRTLEERFARTTQGAAPPRREKVVVAGREFTVSIEKDGKWWIGSVEELPGCGSQGRTLAELRAMLADAIEGYLIVRGDIPDRAIA